VKASRRYRTDFAGALRDFLDRKLIFRLRWLR
jgi:hypothetical protein